MAKGCTRIHRPTSEEETLRVFLGIILGIALTIGTAYITDALRPEAGPDETAARPMVNWDVVADNLHGLSERVQQGWARLTNHPRSTG